MTAEVAEKFEKLQHFDALLKMRNWDNKGKIKNATVDPLDKYENKCKIFLKLSTENVQFSAAES